MNAAHKQLSGKHFSWMVVNMEVVNKRLPAEPGESPLMVIFKSPVDKAEKLLLV